LGIKINVKIDMLCVADDIAIKTNEQLILFNVKYTILSLRPVACIRDVTILNNIYIYICTYKIITRKKNHVLMVGASSEGGFSTQDTVLHCKSILSIMLIKLNCIDRIIQIKKF